jgi:hypothetical protein
MNRRHDPEMVAAEHIDTAIQFVPRNIRRIGDVPPSSASASFARVPGRKLYPLFAIKLRHVLRCT